MPYAIAYFHVLVKLKNVTNSKKTLWGLKNMKKIFLSILFSLLTLNPLACMSLDNIATTLSQDPSDPAAQDLKAVAQQLNKQIEALTKAVQEIDQNADPAQVSKIQEKLSTVSKISEKLSPLPGKISATFDWLSARLDTILTKKGAVKTAFLLGPIIATYCYFFPPELLKYIVELMVSATAKGAATISNAAAKGLLSGVGQGLKDNKEELKTLFSENKKEIKEFLNEVAYEASKIQAEAQINAEYAKAGAYISSWSLFGQSFILTATGSLGAGLAILFKTIIEGLGKKIIGVK